MIYTLKNYLAHTTTAKLGPPFTYGYLIDNDAELARLTASYDAVLVCAVTDNYTGHLTDAMRISRRDGKGISRYYLRPLRDIIPDLLEPGLWRYVLPLTTYVQTRTVHGSEGSPEAHAVRQTPYEKSFERPRSPLNDIIAAKQAQPRRVLETFLTDDVRGIPKDQWLTWPKLYRGDEVVDPVCMLCARHGEMILGRCMVGDVTCAASIQPILTSSMFANLRDADELLKELEQEVYL